MKQDILDNAREFLITYIKGKTVDYENLHPWRKRWEFAVMHSFRVEAYAVKIAVEEKRDISNDELLLIKLAAILHDIGRVDVAEGHARLSAEIVGSWLKENTDIEKEIGHTQRLLHVIANHSDKTGQDSDFCSAVLKDADILDEIGAMSIFMTANHLDKNSPFFFEELSKRLQTFELGYCDKQMNRLNTQTAKRVLQIKKEFIDAFTAQLQSELKIEEDAITFMKMNL